jgi:hypothetical protein
MPYGYDRVSMLDQELSGRLDALAAAGCIVVRLNGTTPDGREVATLQRFMHERRHPLGQNIIVGLNKGSAR